MTAFHDHLIAIAISGKGYTVHSHAYAALDSGKLKRDGLLHDVSENNSYIDEAAILQKLAVPTYFLPESNPFRQETVDWYHSLPPEVFFVLFHKAQFESGL